MEESLEVDLAFRPGLKDNTVSDEELALLESLLPDLVQAIIQASDER